MKELVLAVRGGGEKALRMKGAGVSGTKVHCGRRKKSSKAGQVSSSWIMQVFESQAKDFGFNA